LGAALERCRGWLGGPRTVIDLDDLQTAVAGHERRPRHRGDAEAPNSNRIQSSSLDHKVDTSATTTPSKDENEPVLSCSADQRRQCMRDGIHRRTAGRQPTTKRMRGHIHATLLTFATLLSSVSCHMAEPAVQIAGGLREVSQAFHIGYREAEPSGSLCGRSTVNDGVPRSWARGHAAP
jgi:hypothetical protein